MTEKEFDIWYDQKVEDAVRNLPDANKCPIPIIEVAVIFDGMFLTPFMGDRPPMYKKTYHSIFFEKKRNINGFYWDRRR